MMTVSCHNYMYYVCETQKMLENVVKRSEKMLENVVKRSEFGYTREQRYTKVIYYYDYSDGDGVDEDEDGDDEEEEEEDNDDDFDENAKAPNLPFKQYKHNRTHVDIAVDMTTQLTKK